jgi:hypothetical protein
LQRSGPERCDRVEIFTNSCGYKEISMCAVARLAICAASANESIDLYPNISLPASMIPVAVLLLALISGFASPALALKHWIR